MNGLLIKDWKLLKNQGKFFFVILLVANLLLFLGANNTEFIASYITFVFSMFVLSTVSYDTYENGMIFLMSLPINRKTYVTEKYLFALLITFCSWLTAILLRLGIFALQSCFYEKLDLLYADPIYLFLSLVFLSFALPIHLKFGPEKGQMISFGILAISFVSIFTALRIGLNTTLLHNIKNRLDQSPVNIIIAAGGFCILFFGISYMLSLVIMEKKEF